MYPAKQVHQLHANLVPSPTGDHEAVREGKLVIRLVAVKGRATNSC